MGERWSMGKLEKTWIAAAAEAKQASKQQQEKRDETA